ncbi:MULTISPECIES: hypothetical protein [unclassified Rhizobium]
MKSYTYSFRQLMLPYCIEDLEDGWFLFLNRRYKPIGQMNDEWVDYQQHPSKVIIKKLTSAKARSIGLNRLEEKYYLYNDATNPERDDANWRRYEAMLQKISALLISPNG